MLRCRSGGAVQSKEYGPCNVALPHARRRDRAPLGQKIEALEGVVPAGVAAAYVAPASRPLCALFSAFCFSLCAHLLGAVTLSFPKIQSGGIRAVRQNQRIIRCDVCDHPPCVYRKLDSAVVVMKAAKDGRRYEAARMLDGAMDRSVFVERPMSPQLVIVRPRQRRGRRTRVGSIRSVVQRSHSAKASLER
jgi:hypothetical protein